MTETGSTMTGATSPQGAGRRWAVTLAAALAVAVSLAAPGRAAACTLTTTGAATVSAGALFTLTLGNAGGVPTSWTISWGDDTIQTLPGNPATATHTYAARGTPSAFTYNILASAVCGGQTFFQNDLAVSSALNNKLNWYQHNAPGTNVAVARVPAQSGPNFAMTFPTDPQIGPDGKVYLTAWTSSSVVRYNPTTGAVIDNFIPAGSGGLNGPSGLAFGPDGRLYVTSYFTKQVLRYNGTTGAFIGVFVTAGLGGLDQANGLIFGPDGNLYVSDQANTASGNAVYRYNGTTGAFIDKFVASGSGGLGRPDDLVFGPDGNLYVASYRDSDVRRYNGTTGAYIDEFVVQGAGPAQITQALGVAFGPDGNFYVASEGSDSVKRYNRVTGAYIDDYVSVGLGGLNGPQYFNFIPGHQVLVVKTTVVELVSFQAAGFDGAVDLAWETGSEIDNLGFHVYRSRSEGGPFERITPALIPGLGASVSGRAYSYRDSGLVNGVTCFYKLEDVDTSGVTTLHGPVTATPSASSTGGGSDPSGGGDGSGTAGRVVHGNPSTTSLTVVERDAQHVLVELLTGGFFSRQNPDGTVEIEVPGFESTAPPGAPDLPTRSTWLDAIAGRKAIVTSIEALDPVVFSDLRPAPAGTPDLDVSRDGNTVRPTRLSHSADPALHRGLYPRAAARIVGTGFQQETKKAHLQLSPLRWNASTEQLLLARRLLVRIDFTGSDSREISLGGSRGRRPVVGPRPSPGAIQLLTRDQGLYRVLFEDVYPTRRYALPVARLHLSRQGEPVPFFVDRSVFGPGASLYFLSNGASLNPNADHATYELTRTPGGVRMATASAPPSGLPTSFSWHFSTFEQNKTYQAGLLDAPDLFLWEVLVSPITKSYPFTVAQLASTSEPARLSVDLQGGSDFAADPDHHVRLYMNGGFVGEASWDGKLARTLTADVPSGLLLEGANTLQIENVGDTTADYSMVFLDRFSLSYPRLTSAVAGVFEGTVSTAGAVDIAGLGAGSVLVDTTDVGPRWLTGATPSALGMAFHAETGHRYLAVSPEAILRPEVRVSAAVNLRATLNRADYVLIGPREFLPAATSLISLRQSQGLRTKTVALEDVYDQFGFGEEGPEAVKAFLTYAYHSWQKPSLRYVLLLGDASYDPKNFLKSGTKDRLPTPITKTTFIWTASDPSYAQVNGDDLLPDFAIGRLPAASLAEAQILVDKILAFENAHRDLTGPAVLVADNEDEAGPFEKNADEIASLLPGNLVEKLYLRDLAAQGQDTRTAIRNALDDGASLMSYVGHGSIAVWASENVWNNLDVQTLKPQPQQPILLTLDCLNGFFHFPPLNSLTEQMVKAEGKGAVAAVSPSGLSLDEPAHLFHKALVQHLRSGAHSRLGDALLAAQADYATSGAFPELLDIYHLFGDPAMKVR